MANKDPLLFKKGRVRKVCRLIFFQDIFPRTWGNGNGNRSSEGGDSFLEICNISQKPLHLLTCFQDFYKPKYAHFNTTLIHIPTNWELEWAGLPPYIELNRHYFLCLSKSNSELNMQKKWSFQLKKVFLRVTPARGSSSGFLCSHIRS